MNTKNFVQVMAAFGFVVTAASIAQAEVVQYNYTSSAFLLGTTPTLVPITSTGATTITFVSKRAGLTAVTFSAECVVQLSGGNNWATIDILIDGIAIAPTEGDEDAFCTEVSNESVYGTNSITVARRLTKGTHTLTVKSYVTGGSGRLDDIAVTVWR